VKVYQELAIGPLTETQEDQLILRIVGQLSGGWSRDVAREEEMRRQIVEKLYCFACTAQGERKAASLYLAHPGYPSGALLRVSNIVPSEIRELGYDQYNYILREFHGNFVKPAGDALDIRVELSSPEQTLESWLGQQSAGLLRAFSHGANKSTGSSHPMDRRRWLDFLIAIHRAREDLDSGLLERWLVEEERWPDDIASDLISQFEFSQDLLRRFENAR
jgi:hypothetical protein